MKNLFLAVAMLFAMLSFSQETHAQNITVSGLAAGCFGSAPNGTYTRQVALVNGKYRYNGPSGFYIAWSGGTFSTASYGTIGPAWRLYGGPAPGAHYHCLVDAGLDAPCATPSSPFTEQWRGDYGCGSITVAGSCGTPPQTVSSFNTVTNASLSSMRFTINFSGAVTGLSTSNFTIGGTAPGTSIAAVTGSGSTWYVHVNSGSGTGTINVTLANSTGATTIGSLPQTSSSITKTAMNAGTLSAGDLVFTSYFSDGGDRFSFVNAVDIPANETIYFTDHGWNGDSWGSSSSEGIIQWSHTALIPAGTQITITGLTASLGTATNKENAATGLNLSASGDQIFAFQAQTNLIAGLHYNVYTSAPVSNDAGWDNQNSVTSTTTSTKPPGLTTGMNAMRAGTEFDNGKLTCTGLPAADAAALRAYANDDANWVFDNDGLTIGSAFPACPSFLTVCANTTATISPSICQGATYTSPSTNYMWTTTGTYMDTIMNAGGCDSVITINLTVNAPTVTTSPSSASFCVGAVTSTSITASGAVSYSWSPSAGLNTTTGATVSALPTSTTTYIVTGTDANTCTNTASVNISINGFPVLDSITASPAAVCSGTTSQLNTNFLEAPSTFDQYSFNVSTGAALDPMTGASTAVGSGNDDTYISGHAIGFSFSYNGTAYTTFGASSNGFMVLGGAGGSSDLGNGFGSSMLSANLPMIAPWWDDNHTGTGGITFTTIGTAPNRICIVDFDLEVRYLASANNAKMQVRLHEGTNAIDIVYGPSTALSSPSGSIGLAGTTTTAEMQSVNTSTNTASTTTASNSNTVMPTAGTMYSWVPPTTGGPVTGYAWTPPAMVVSSTSASTATTALTSTTTFIVTATNMAGCSDTASVEVQVNPLGAATATATVDTFCEGGSTQLDVAISGGGLPYTYVWTPNTGMAASADSTKNPTANPTVTTTYTVTVTDACNVTATSSITITVNPNPTVMATISDTSVCANDTVNLNATGADTYVWDPGSLSGAMQTVTPPGGATTDYIVTGTTTATGCFSMDTVSVTTTPTFYVNASATPTTICVGDSVALNAVDSNLSAPFCFPNYTTGTGSGDFIDSVGGFGGLLQNQTGAGSAPYYQLFPTPIAVTAATAYSVTVRNGSFGSQEQAIWIDYNHDSIFQVSELVGQVNSIASNALTTFTVNIPTSAYNGTTLMRISDQYSGDIPVMDPCEDPEGFGETEDYVLNISGATAAPAPIAYTWAWEPGALAGAMQTVYPTVTTTYTVTQTHPTTGCEAVDSVMVNVSATPTLTISANPANGVCDANDPITVMSGATGADTYTWNGNPGGMDTLLSPVVAGTYTVVATDTMSMCSVTDSIAIYVFTPQALDSLVASPATICENDSSTLQAYVGLVAPLSYCASNATSLIDTKIDTVSFAGVTVGSSPTTNENYTDNTATIIPVTAGSAYPLFVRKGDPGGTSYTAYLKVFIDYDQNGTFDPSEEVYGVAGGSPVNSIPATTITIPATALNGTTQMRAVLRESGNATNTVACGTYTYGETEDYTVLISGGAENINPGFATINWMPSASLNMASGDSVIAQGLTATTMFTAIGTDLNGCIDTNTVTVTVTPSPTIAASITLASICVGDTSMLTGSGTADTYVWNPGMLMGANQSVAPTMTTAYTLTGTDTMSGCTADTSIVLSVNPLPVLTVSVDSNETCPGDMNGGATALAPPPYTSVFLEEFTNTFTNETNFPNAAAPGWTRTNSTGRPDWALESNGTGSGSTGPSAGAQSTTGYAYLEVSCVSGGTDTLISPAITIPSGAGSSARASFFTHMYGSNSGKMELFIDDGTAVTSVWVDSGQTQTSSAAAWDSISVNLDAYVGQTVNMIFVGTAANPGGCAGDRGLDQINVEHAPAPSSLLWSTSDTTSSITNLMAGTYTVTATTAFGCTATDSVTLTAGAVPTLAVSTTPSTAVCAGDTVTLMSGATGATSYTWNGVASGADTVLAPAIAGTYTVVATDDTSSCSATDSIMVIVNAYPTFAVTATPDTVCAGDSVQLNTTPQFSNDYLLTSIPHAPVAPTGTPTIAVTGDDNSSNIAIPFPFDFYGITYSSINVSTNGFASFTSTASGCCTGQVLPSTSTPNAVIALAWEDLNQNSGGNIEYYTEGTAPNRQFIIRYDSVAYFGSDGDDVVAQIVLNETTNTIEIHGTTGGPYAGSNTTMGIENETGTLATTVPGRNSQSPWTMSNEGWLFTPSTNPGTTVWTPGTGLSNPTFPNPIANPTVTTTYTVNVTQNGCTTIDSVDVTVNPLPIVMATAAPTTALCPGDTAMLNGSSTTATSYVWEPGALSGLSQSVTPAASTAYILSGTDAVGCVGMDTVNVMVNPAPALTVTVDSNETCPGAMNGGATALAPNVPINIYLEEFTNTFTSETNIPNAAAPGWTRFSTGARPEWSLESNNTGSASTGPNEGAQNSQGYAYLEVSCVSGGSDTLTSPSIDLTSVTGQIDLGFFTHMYGPNSGKMEVFIDNGTTLTSVWVDSGQTQASSAAAWDSISVNIDAYAGQMINLRFVGTAANPGGCSGDRGLDQVTINNTLPSSLLWSTTDTTASIMGLTAGTYSVTATNSFGCTSMDSAVITSLPGAMVTVTPTPGVSNCLGGSVDLVAMGASSYLWMPGSATGDTLPVPAYTGSNTYMVTGTDSNGCTDTASVVVTQTIPNGNLTQAAPSNAASNPGTQMDGFSHPNNGLMYSYFDTTCAIIASVQEAAGGVDLGFTSTMVTVDATVPVHNTQPFVARWFQISPTNQGAADVTLYATQDDFDDYNTYASANGWPLLPANSADAAGIANLRITKNDNGGLGVNPIVITPAGVVWNSSSMRWELTFNTPGFSQFRMHALNPGNAALSVTYKDFTVRKQATSDLVEWTTLNEENNRHFNVQRSADGQSYETLGTVNSKAVGGLSAVELSYSFVDENPQTGHNYYRLEQVDLDNNMAYTEVIDIVWGANGSVVSIYPNPAKDKLNIDISAADVALTEIKLLDMSGRVVKSIMAQTVKGMNHITLEIDDVAVGVYGVQVFENNKLTHVSKVRKN